MKKVLAVVVVIAAVVVVAHAALAFIGPRHWARMEHPMMMQMGPHMMGQEQGRWALACTMARCPRHK